MTISFTCPHCGKQSTVADEYAGQSGPCRFCSNTITIPATGTPPTLPPAPQPPVKGSGTGATIGIVAVVAKQELLLVLVGGLFVLEGLSVVIQVVSYKLRGKRVFRMAPLHHHFEMAGWNETQVVVRFWIIAVVFALAGLSTLKLR